MNVTVLDTVLKIRSAIWTLFHGLSKPRFCKCSVLHGITNCPEIAVQLSTVNYKYAYCIINNHKSNEVALDCSFSY